ncbi:hypothetical protein PFISCL1PPCAC_8691, partial [Pristionchus fissidentatus]
SRLVLLKAFYDILWLSILFIISSSKFFIIYRVAVYVFDGSSCGWFIKREKDLEPYRREAQALYEQMHDNFNKR